MIKFMIEGLFITVISYVINFIVIKLIKFFTTSKISFFEYKKLKTFVTSYKNKNILVFMYFCWKEDFIFNVLFISWYTNVHYYNLSVINQLVTGVCYYILYIIADSKHKKYKINNHSLNN